MQICVGTHIHEVSIEEIFRQLIRQEIYQDKLNDKFKTEPPKEDSNGR